MHILSYTVTFDSDGGSAVKEQKVDSGKTATEPEAPKLEGMAFLGWYDGENEFDFATPITKDITLKAKWTETDYHVVTYTLPAGVAVTRTGFTATTRVLVGTKITLPDVTEVNVTAPEGHALKSWNVKVGDEQIGTDYEPGTVLAVMDDMVITPKTATAKAVDFKVKPSDDAAVTAGTTGANAPYVPQSVGEGGVAAEPVAPTRPGYEFLGWGVANEAGTGYDIYDFGPPVTGAVHLVGQWKGIGTNVVVVDADNVQNLTLNGKDSVELGDELTNVKLDYDGVAAIPVVEPSDEPDGDTPAWVTSIAFLAPEDEDLEVKKFKALVSDTEPDAEALAGVTAQNSLDDIYADYDVGEIVKGAKIDLDLVQGWYSFANAAKYTKIATTYKPDMPVYVAVQFVYDDDASNWFVLRLAHPKAAELAAVELYLGADDTVRFVDEAGKKTAYSDYTEYVVKAGAYKLDAEPVSGKNAFDKWSVYLLDGLMADLPPEVQPNANGEYAFDGGSTYAVVANWTDGVTIDFDDGELDGDTVVVNGEMEPVTLLAGDEYTLPACAYSAKGYKFIGWHAAKITVTTGGGDPTINVDDPDDVIYDDEYLKMETVLQPGDKITLGKNAESFTLVAEWDKGVTVTYGNNIPEAAVVVGDMDAVVLERDSELTLPACGYSSKGYKFVGWLVKPAEAKDVIYDGEYVDNGEGVLLDAGEVITVGSGDVTVTAQFEALRAITLVNGATNEASEAIYGAGDEYEVPTNPFTAETGKKFAGWKVDANTFVDADGEAITADDILQPGDKIYVKAGNTPLKLTAQWDTLVKVTLSAGELTVPAGFDNSIASEMIYFKGDEYVVPENPFVEVAGKQLKNWKPDANFFKDAACTVATAATDVLKPGDKLYIGASDATLTAVWDDVYTVSFDENEGTGTMADVSVIGGTKYELPECTFTAPTGKEFDYWKFGDLETKYQPGAKVEVNANVTVKANWKDVAGVILRDTKTTPDADVFNAVANGVDFTLPECSFTAPTGYEFAGWNTKADGTGTAKAVGDIVKGTTTATPYFAMWKPIVQFNQGTPAYGNLIADANQAKVTVVDVEKDEELTTQYGVDTYKLSADAAVVYLEENVHFSTESDLQKGHYIGLTMNVAKDAVDGANLTIVGTKTNTGALTGFIDDNPFITGAKYEGQVTLVARIDDVMAETAPAAKDLFKVELEWKNKTKTNFVLHVGDLKMANTVTFKNGQGSDSGQAAPVTGTMADVTVNAGETYTIPAAAYTTSSNKIVTNWTAGTTVSGTRANGTAFTNQITLYSGDTIVMPNATVTLTAVWSGEGFYVTFDANGGTLPANMPNPLFVAKDTGIEEVLGDYTITRTGYTLTGWVDTKTGNRYAVDDSTNIVTAMNLKAQWTGVSLTVGFNENGGLIPSGASAPATMNFVYGSTAKLSKNTYTKANYRFIGWGTSPDGEVLYTDEQDVGTLLDPSISTITLYAIWEEAYKITYSFTDVATYIDGFKADATYTEYVKPGETLTLPTLDQLIVKQANPGKSLVWKIGDTTYAAGATVPASALTTNVTATANWIDA